MIYHSECSTRQCARIWSDNPQLSQVIWDQTTSDLPVYNLQLPQKKDGHLGRDGHRVRHWQHGRNCRHGHDHQGSHGRHFTFIMVVMVSMVFMVNIVFRKSLQERQDRQDNQNTRNTQIWHLTWPSRQLVKGNFRNSCDVLVSRNWYWESLCTAGAFFCRQWQNLTICLFRLVWKNMFLQWKNSEGCFASGRSTEDEIIQNFLIDSSLGTSQSQETWLWLQPSQRNCLHILKAYFLLLFCQTWRP